AGRLLRPLQTQHQLDQLFLAQSLKIAPAHQCRESAIRPRRKGVGNYAWDHAQPLFEKIWP
ncbi:MAG TPA: hypothetical protein VHL98_22585, partial [Microvirga sp.]|nr:hypothetical protein [Microvirga sp.]